MLANSCTDRPIPSSALAICAAPAERRTFCEDFAVVLVLAARPLVTRFAARMLLRVGAAFGSSRVAVAIPLAGTVEFRTVLAPLTGAIKSRPLKVARAIARRTRTTFRTIRIGPALLPRLGFTSRRTIAKILARTTARKFLVAAKFPLGPIAVARGTVKVH